MVVDGGVYSATFSDWALSLAVRPVSGTACSEIPGVLFEVEEG